MLLSVIIPAYNCEKTVRKCIDSIINQNIDRIEIIAVDDGSADNTLEVLESIAVIHNTVKIIRQKNSGVSAARNKGLENATGKYVMFVDSDDKLVSHSLKKVLEKMENEKYDFLIANHKRILRNSKGQLEEKIPQVESNQYNSKEAIWNDIIRLLNVGMINAPWGKIYLRSILEANHIKMDESLSMGEDLQFNLSYLEYANSLLIIPDVLYSYNTQNSFLTKLYRANMFDERKRSIQLLKKHFVKHKINLNLIYFLYLKLFFANVMQENEHKKKFLERKRLIQTLLKKSEIIKAKKNYIPDSMFSWIMLAMIKSNNCCLIDLFSKCAVWAKNYLYKDRKRISV